MRRLGQFHDAMALPLAHTAAELSSHAAWHACGYQSLEDFARERFQRTGRWFREIVSIHRLASAFPALAEALRGTNGIPTIGRKAALCIGRVATPATIDSWIDRARTFSLPQLRAAVEAERATGTGTPTRDAPGSEPGPCEGMQTNAGAASSRRAFVRLHVPPEAHLSFDAVRQLHTAIAGRDAGLGAFVEALVGEAAGLGWDPPDTPAAPLRSQSRNEARATWREKGDDRDHRSQEPYGLDPNRVFDVDQARPMPFSASSPGLRRALTRIRELELLEQRRARLLRKLEAGLSGGCARTRTRDIRRLAGIFERLLRLENLLEVDMGLLLLELHEQRAWPGLRFASLEHYAEARLGMAASTARRRVALARQLRRHARLRRAYESGEVGEEAARWIARRIQGTQTQDQETWLAFARESTVKRLRDEDHLRGRQKLEMQLAAIEALPWNTSAPGSATARRVPPAATHAPVDDATWHESLCLVPGRTRTQVFAWGHGLLRRLARRGPMTQVPLTLSLSREAASDLLGCIESARRDLMARAGETPSPSQESRLRPSERLARALGRSGLPAWRGLLAVLEEAAWVWDEPRAMPRREYEAVYRRDGFRCMAPGCTRRVRLETHHIRYRSRGGSEEPENLIVLCMFHHRQGEHGDLARCRGTAPLHVTWRLGADGLETWWRNERRLEKPAAQEPMKICRE